MMTPWYVIAAYALGGTLSMVLCAWAVIRILWAHYGKREICVERGKK